MSVQMAVLVILLVLSTKYVSTNGCPSHSIGSEHKVLSITLADLGSRFFRFDIQNFRNVTA